MPILSVLRASGPSAGHVRRSRRRQPLLVAHIGFSAGWIGLNTALLTLGVVALATSQPATLRAIYVALGWLGISLIAPFSIGSLGTGILIALRGRWGLLRYWWVTVKFIIAIGVTIGANLLLDLRLQSAANRVTAGGTLTASSVGVARYVAVVLPVIQTVLLLTALVLSIYRPWGLTSIGERRRAAATADTGATAAPQSAGESA